MRMNRAMKPHWQDYQTSTKLRLPRHLRKMLDSKFVEMYGCILLESTIPSNWRTEVHAEHGPLEDLPQEWKNDFTDRTGYEHFISKIHIEDFVKDHFFQYAMAFLTGVFRLFQAQYPTKTLQGTISIDNGVLPDSVFSCCVSYHVKREGESWLAPDIDRGGIENYKDAIFVMDSDEVNTT